MKHSSKVKYADQGDAIAAALSSSKRAGRPFRPYACDECDGWHITGWTTPHPENRRRPAGVRE